MRKKLNVKIGTKFGKWEVISDETIKKNNITHWLCRCDCGETEDYIPINNLMNGTSTQCINCARKLVGEKKRKGYGDISAQMWSRYTHKYGDDLKLKIIEAWGLYEQQERICPITDQYIEIHGYPYDIEKTTAFLVKYESDKPLDKTNSIWVHKSVYEFIKNKSLNDLFKLIKRINDNIHEDYHYLLD